MPRLQFSLRAFLVLPIVLALILGSWLEWIKPRLEFEKNRRRSSAVLAPDDKLFPGRRLAIATALEEIEYGSASPILAFAAMMQFRNPPPSILVDWVDDDDVRVDGLAVLLPDGESVSLGIRPCYHEHRNGTLLHVAEVASEDNPLVWPRIAKVKQLRIALTSEGQHVSNPLDVTFIGSEGGKSD